MSNFLVFATQLFSLFHCLSFFFFFLHQYDDAIVIMISLRSNLQLVWLLEPSYFFYFMSVNGFFLLLLEMLKEGTGLSSSFGHQITNVSH